jgi:glycosyltransferase involved in cell wall biosynthesis
MVQALHQFVGGFAGTDAVSNQARAMRTIFRSWGLKSEIFCEARRIQPQLRSDIRDISQWNADSPPGDMVFLHLSTGSIVNDVFSRLQCRKVIMYHNITPARFFEPVQKQIAQCLAMGRRQAGALAGKCDIALAQSKFNADEMSAMGFKDVRVVPLILDVEALRVAPDRKILKKYRDGKTNVLFVGRGAPNKKLEDLIIAFAVFQKTVCPSSRLIIAGSIAGLEPYHFILRALARDLAVKNVEFTGSVSQSDLSALYQCSQLFLCMSEHEGFCIPLLESMYHNLPILAYAAAAVPETLAGAGILFREKKFEQVAEMMGRIATDQAFRSAVIARQSRRIREFLALDPASEMKKQLAPLIGDG